VETLFCKTARTTLSWENLSNTDIEQTGMKGLLKQLKNLAIIRFWKSCSNLVQTQTVSVTKLHYEEQETMLCLLNTYKHNSEVL